jgi:hypothetical protein
METACSGGMPSDMKGSIIAEKPGAQRVMGLKRLFDTGTLQVAKPSPAAK